MTIENGSRLSIDEAKKMVGTEFTYVYEDGDTIKAYVKAFDPAVGLTCYTLETETADGWFDEDRDGDGTWCVVGCDASIQSHYDGMFQYLASIKDTGRIVITMEPGIFRGCAF